MEFIKAYITKEQRELLLDLVMRDIGYHRGIPHPSDTQLERLGNLLFLKKELEQAGS